MLGIASPSKVFEGIGDYTTEGYTNALDDGTQDVQSSMSEMLAVPPANDVVPDAAEQLKQAQLAGDTDAISRLQGAASPAVSGAAPAGGDSRGGGSGGGVTFAGNPTFVFQGLPAATGAIDAFQEMLDAAIEGDAAKLGAAAARGKAAA
jgi:hypothetical protein